MAFQDRFPHRWRGHCFQGCRCFRIWGWEGLRGGSSERKGALARRSWRGHQLRSCLREWKDRRGRLRWDLVLYRRAVNCLLADHQDAQKKGLVVGMKRQVGSPPAGRKALGSLKPVNHFAGFQSSVKAVMLSSAHHVDCLARGRSPEAKS